MPALMAFGYAACTVRLLPKAVVRLRPFVPRRTISILFVKRLTGKESILIAVLGHAEQSEFMPSLQSTFDEQKAAKSRHSRPPDPRTPNPNRNGGD